MAQQADGLSEDWLAVALGLFIFLLSLGPLMGLDLLGFAAAPKSWIELGSAIKPAGDAYEALGGCGALLFTYAFALILMVIAALALRVEALIRLGRTSDLVTATEALASIEPEAGLAGTGQTGGGQDGRTVVPVKEKAE